MYISICVQGLNKFLKLFGDGGFSDFSAVMWVIKWHEQGNGGFAKLALIKRL